MKKPDIKDDRVTAKDCSGEFFGRFVVTVKTDNDKYELGQFMYNTAGMEWVFFAKRGICQRDFNSLFRILQQLH